MEEEDEEGAVNDLLERSRDGLHLQDVSEHTRPLNIRTSFLEVIESVPLFHHLVEEADAGKSCLENWSFQDAEIAFKSIQRKTDASLQVRTLAYQFFCHKLHLMLQSDMSEDVGEGTCQSVTHLCKSLKIALGHISQNCRVLQNMLLTKSTYLPLLILQVLIDEEIMDLLVYLKNQYLSGQMGLFKSQLLNLLERSNVKSSSHSIRQCISFFISKIVAICYEEQITGKMSDPQQYLLIKNELQSSIIKDMMTEDLKSMFGVDQRTYNLCSIIGSNSNLQQGIKHDFFIQYLQTMLVGQQQDGEDLAVRFTNHAKCCFKDVTDEGKHMLQFFFVTLDLETILFDIKGIIDSDKLDITRLLKFLAVAIAAFSDVAQEFVNFLDSLFSQALEELKETKLMISMLLIRHCIVCDRDVFPSYEEWLKKLFTGEALSNKPCLALYCKVLTRIIPHEQPEFLRHQIVIFPQVPRALQSIADDCLSLLKARLSELRADPKHATQFRKPLSNSPQAVQDVEVAMKYFQENGAVPRTLIEMSVFKKVYFENSFLPALLIPSSDPCDARKAFAEKLKDAGKITKQIWESFINSCKQLAFLEALNRRGNDAFEFLLRQIRELGDLPQAINKKERYKLTLRTYICHLEGHLEQFIRSNVENVDFLLMLGQIADEMLNEMCRYVKNSGSVGDSISIINLKWLKDLLIMLAKFDELWKSFNMRLQHLARMQFGELELYHIYTLAAICCSAESIRSSLPIGQHPHTLLRDLAVTKSVFCWKYQLFILRFVGIYLLVVTSAGKDIILTPEETKGAFDDMSFVLQINVIQLFIFCHKRLQFIRKLSEEDKSVINFKYLQHSKNMDQVQELVESILTQPRVADFVSACQLSAKNWIKFEIRVSLYNDLVSVKRKLFYLKRSLSSVEQMQQSTPEGICRDIFEALIEQRVGCHIDQVCEMGKTCQAGDSNSEYEIVNLLRSLSETLACVDKLKNESSGTNNWLLESLSHFITQVKSDNRILYGASTQAMIEVCCCLPSSELFRRCRNPEGIKSALCTLAKIVNCMSLQWQRKDLALPGEISEYFMKALVWLSTSEDVNSLLLKSLQSFLLDECTILLVSVLSHQECIIWSFPCDSSSFIEFLINIRNALKSQWWDVLLQSTNKTIFALLMTITFPKDIVVEKSFLLSNKHIPCAILEPYLISWCIDFFQGGVDFQTYHPSVAAASDLVERDPSCLKAFAVEKFDYSTLDGLGTVRHSLIEETTTHLYPVALLRIFGHIGQNRVRYLIQDRQTHRRFSIILEQAHCIICKNSFGMILPPMLDSIRQIENLLKMSAFK